MSSAEQPTRRGLGRGLEVLVGGGGASELLELPITAIRPNPRQPRKRFEPESTSGLAASIRHQGVLQPVVVRPRAEGGYELIAGERRWRAAQEAGIATLPAVVRESDDREALLLGLVENVARSLLDYQLFREDLADQWTRRQVAATKSVDPEALVSVGLIQWSVPVGLAGSFQYSAFRPCRQARLLDFMEVHFYPLANGFYEYQSEESKLRNLAYLECVVREVARCGKPTVIGEFGWYGGGKLAIDAGRHPAATEEQQARWCRDVVESTAGWASGWLNWGFHDHTGAGDVTELTGLLTVGGKVKAWGRTFQELSATLQRRPAEAVRLVNRPTMDWDLSITDRGMRDAFRERYFQAFQVDDKK